MRGKKKRVRAESSRVAAIANQARKELSEYLIKNNLDPMMDWDEDPIHGKVTKRLNKIILFNEQKAKLMAKKEKDEKITKKKRLKKPNVMPEKVREVPKKQPRVYEYPQVDGRDMTSIEKKKYRQKMRVLMKTEMPIKEAQEKAIKYCKGSGGEEKPVKKATKEEKPIKKTKKVETEKTKKVKGEKIKPKKANKEEKPVKKVKKTKREED